MATLCPILLVQYRKKLQHSPYKSASQGLHDFSLELHRNDYLIVFPYGFMMQEIVFSPCTSLFIKSFPLLPEVEAEKRKPGMVVLPDKEL